MVSLQDHLRRGGPTLSPAAAAEAMAITEKVDTLQLLGERGAKVCEFNPPLELSNRSFDFILLQLGANDVAAGQTPTSTATAIMAIAHMLLDHKVTKLVAICSLLPRSGNVRNKNYPTDMRQCNSLLYHVWGGDQHSLLVSWGFLEGPHHLLVPGWHPPQHSPGPKQIQEVNPTVLLPDGDTAQQAQWHVGF